MQRSSATHRIARPSFVRHARVTRPSGKRSNRCCDYEDAGDQFLERPAVEEVARLVSSHPESNVDFQGRRLGVYQIEARIGAGGMGEVYRARDTKLGRDVAIKVCRANSPAAPIAARDSSAKRVCSRRSIHPHIAQVYGFEESEGSRRW
jgi:serine/threonine protein kinase